MTSFLVLGSSWKNLAMPVSMDLPSSISSYESHGNHDRNKVAVVQREQWSRKIDFLLSCLGYAVGLGNIWRFPYLCYRHGGGAFLIPYGIVMVICALPIFFLELSLGQYHGKGPVFIFKNIAPAFRGVGVAMLVVTFFITVYYNMVMAWGAFYMFASFSSTVEWESCSHTWNSPGCHTKEMEMQCQASNLTFWNGSCREVGDVCKSLGQVDGTFMDGGYCLNASGSNVPVSDIAQYLSASEDYYLRYMLDKSSGLDDFGNLRWQLVLCLLFSWTIVAICMIKGVQSSGKVVYFTALFPYVLLVFMFVRALTLDGASDGIYFYLVPKWEKLLSAQAWGDAATQIFFSIGIGLGSWHTLASYNKFENNCCKDAVLIGILNSATSILSGFVVFSALGVMAHSLGVSVDAVVGSGPGLIFIVFPEAITKMPISPMWSFLFFFMIILLGLDTMFSLCEALVTAVKDVKPELRKYTPQLTILLCTVCFLLGLPFCAQGGIYLFQLMEWYSATWSLLIICLFQLGAVSWCYGTERFSLDVKDMIGSKPNVYWKFCWRYLSPVVLMGVLLFNIYSYTPASLGNYVFSYKANAIGWLLSFSSVLIIPILGIYEFYKALRGKNGISAVFRPTDDWGPATSSLPVSTELKDAPITWITDGPTNTAKYNPCFVDELRT